MSRITSTLLATAGALTLAACAGVPDESELNRLDGSAIESEIVGNTYTLKRDYGRWAEYIPSLDHGYARAWGTWGSDSATSRHEIASDGEWCTKYSGDPEWASADHDYCRVIYAGPEGQLYLESTKNTSTPERVGKIRPMEIRRGDDFGLADQ